MKMQHDVDGEQRADVVGDVAAGHGGDDHRAGSPQTRSIAAPNAARMPARSSASRPRAVEPPGEVTSRLTASVS